MSTLLARLPLILAVGVAVAFLGFYAMFASRSTLPDVSGDYRVNVALKSSEALAKNASVTIAGLPVGKVESIMRTSDGARVELSLSDKYAPISTDSRFAVRLRTVVGENYIEIEPGGGAELPSGGTLPAGRAREYVNVDEILNALRGETRQNARTTMRALGYAVNKRGPQLNTILGEASATVKSASPVLEVLRARRAQVARLTDDLGVVTDAIGQRRAAVKELADSGVAVVRAVAARDDALRDTLDRLPATLDTVRDTTRTVRSVSRTGAPVLRNLGGAVKDLKPTVRSLQPAAVEGGKVLDEVDRIAPPLSGTLDRVRKLTPSTVDALPKLRKVLCQVNPALRFLAPYHRELPAILQGMGSSGNFYDTTGHAFRLGVTFGVESLKHLYPAGSSELLGQVLQSGLISKSVKLGYNPLPKPGEAGEVYQEGMATNQSNYKGGYTRVMADC